LRPCRWCFTAWEWLAGLDVTRGGSLWHIHQTIAPYLIGKDPCNIERHQPHLSGYVGFIGSGAESRGRSAIDIALWDLFGKSVNLPLCDVLGGRVRDSVRVYNTCAGYSYVQTRPTQGTNNFGLEAKQGRYEDLAAFLNNAGELAHSLLEMGIDGMKIWPFDYAAERSAGQYISSADLAKALEPFEKIRSAVGDKMDVMAEMHALWNRPMATRIARALEPFDPLWVEDPVVMDHMDASGEVARSTRAPIAVGETRGMAADYRYLLDLKALSLVIMDVTWCGGISEGRKIAAMAQTYKVPVAFHDCTGPVALSASTHLARPSACRIVAIGRKALTRPSVSPLRPSTGPRPRCRPLAARRGTPRHWRCPRALRAAPAACAPGPAAAPPPC